MKWNTEWSQLVCPRVCWCLVTMGTTQFTPTMKPTRLEYKHKHVFVQTIAYRYAHVIQTRKTLSCVAVTMLP